MTFLLRPLKWLQVEFEQLFHLAAFHLPRRLLISVGTSAGQESVSRTTQINPRSAAVGQIQSSSQVHQAASHWQPVGILKLAPILGPSSLGLFPTEVMP